MVIKQVPVMKGLELSMLFQALLAVIVIGVMMLGIYSFVQRGEFDVIKPIKEFFGFLVGGGENYKVAKASATALTDAINAVCDNKASFSKSDYGYTLGVSCSAGAGGATCTVNNFALPQKVADLAGIVKTSSDPDYLLYYQTFPEGEANWDSLTYNLRYMSLIPMVGGAKAAIKPGSKLVIGSLKDVIAKEAVVDGSKEIAEVIGSSAIRIAPTVLTDEAMQELGETAVERSVREEALYALKRGGSVLKDATKTGLSGLSGKITVVGVGGLTLSEFLNAQQSKYAVVYKLIPDDETTRTYNNFIAFKSNGMFPDPYMKLSASCKDKIIELEKVYAQDSSFYLSSPCYAEQIEVKSDKCYCNNLGTDESGLWGFIYNEPNITTYPIESKECTKICISFNSASIDPEQKCKQWHYDTESAAKKKYVCDVPQDGTTKSCICELDANVNPTQNCSYSRAQSLTEEGESLKEGALQECSCRNIDNGEPMWVRNVCPPEQWIYECKGRYFLPDSGKCPSDTTSAKVMEGNGWKDVCCLDALGMRNVEPKCSARINEFHSDGDSCSILNGQKEAVSPHGIPNIVKTNGDEKRLYLKECDKSLTGYVGYSIDVTGADIWKAIKSFFGFESEKIRICPEGSCTEFGKVNGLIRNDTCVKCNDWQILEKSLLDKSHSKFFDCIKVSIKKVATSESLNYCYGGSGFVADVVSGTAGVAGIMGCGALAATGIGAAAAPACIAGVAYGDLMLYDKFVWPNNIVLTKLT